MRVFILGLLLTACSFQEFAHKVRFDHTSAGNYCTGIIRNQLPFGYFQVVNVDCFYMEKDRGGSLNNVRETRVVHKSDMDFIHWQNDREDGGKNFNPIVGNGVVPELNACKKWSNEARDGTYQQLCHYIEVYPDKKEADTWRLVDDDTIVQYEGALRDASELKGTWLQAHCDSGSILEGKHAQKSLSRITFEKDRLISDTTFSLDPDLITCNNPVFVMREVFSYALEKGMLKLKLISKTMTIKDKKFLPYLKAEKPMGISDWDMGTRDVTKLVVNRDVEMPIDRKSDELMFFNHRMFLKVH